MSSENKKKLIGGSLLGGGIFLYMRYGTQPRVTSGNIDFDNVPAKFISIAVMAVGAYILFKKTNI